MSAFTRIALLGFGEVGQILAADLAKADVTEIAAYDILFAKPDSKPGGATKSFAVRKATSAENAAANAELVISAVTAANDMAAAKSVTGAMQKGTFYLDLNSCSPGQKQAAAKLIDNAGGRYVEGAVMTPYPPMRIASPTLLGGPHANEFWERAKPLGFKCKIFAATIGQASATKMCRSVMIKGIEALLMESMLTARRYGVEKTVLASLSDLLPVGDWEKLAQYMISRSLEHGIRRAEEMREVAHTVEEADITPLMSSACATRQDWAAAHKTALNDDLDAMLDAILNDIDTAKRDASRRA